MMWKPVPGYPGYEASESGQIRGPRGVRKPRWHNDGHLRINVWCFARKKVVTVFVHTLVALAFHGEGAPGQEVRHRDGVPDNNRPGNLVWGTVQENSDDRVAHGRSPWGENNTEAKLTADAVSDLRTGALSVKEAARRYGVTLGSARKAKRGDTWGRLCAS